MSAFNVLTRHSICHLKIFSWWDDGGDQNRIDFLISGTKSRNGPKCRGQNYIYAIRKINLNFFFYFLKNLLISQTFWKVYLHLFRSQFTANKEKVPLHGAW